MELEILRAVDLVVARGGRRWVDHVSLLLTQGSACGLVGRNGAGKNTLADVLAGDDAPDSGVILLDETPASPAQLRAAGLRLGRNSRLLSSLTVPENLLVPLPGHSFWWRAGRMRTLCAELLDAFGLSGCVDAAPERLSASMQHRLLLIRAALHGKRFALLEGVAERYTLEEEIGLLQTIRFVCTHGMAVLYAARRMDHVMHNLPRCVVMKGGHIVKLLRPHGYDPVSLHAYLYGYRAQAPALSPPPAGRVLFHLPGCAVRTGAFLRVYDRDGSAPALVRSVQQACAGKRLPAPAVLDVDTIDTSFVFAMSAFDNVLLSAAPKAARFGFHVGRRMQRVIRQECAARTGLPDTQLSLSPSRLTRTERLHLLLYRFSLRGTRVYVLDRPGIDEGDRAALEQAMRGLLQNGCTVFYIAGGRDELPHYAGPRYLWADGQLQEETL